LVRVRAFEHKTMSGRVVDFGSWDDAPAVSKGVNIESREQVHGVRQVEVAPHSCSFGETRLTFFIRARDEPECFIEKHSLRNHLADSTH
jgi:hypothetical protein